MIRIILAATLVAVFGVTAASAGGRSKDERSAFWQTLHQSNQPWPGMMQGKAISSKPTTSAPAATSAKTPAAAKPAQ